MEPMNLDGNFVHFRHANHQKLGQYSGEKPNVFPIRMLFQRHHLLALVGS